MTIIIFAFLLASAWIGIPAAHEPPLLPSYGAAVAIWENWAFVGEPESFRRPGRVYVYRMVENGSGRVYYPAGILDGAALNDGFGGSLAVADSALLVGQDGGLRPYFLHNGEWRGGAGISAPEGASDFGAAVAVLRQDAFVGAPGQASGRGAVYVMRREGRAWTQVQVLEGEKVGERFGFALSVAEEDGMADGRRTDTVDVFLAVGAPGANEVTMYETGADGLWVKHSAVSGEDFGVTGSFGSAVDLYCRGGGTLAVGAPSDQRYTGSAHVLMVRKEEESQKGCSLPLTDWNLHSSVSGADERDRFGLSVAVRVSGDGLAYWVASAQSGLHEYSATVSPQNGVLPEAILPRRWGTRPDRMGTALAVADDMVLAGAPGADYGAGKMLVMHLGGAEHGTVARDTLLSEQDTMEAIAGAPVECENQMAGGFACSEVDLLSFLPLKAMKLKRGVRLNDIWGWKDPETGREYALVGHLEGTAMVDVSDPGNPQFLGELPRTAGTPGSTWRDIKVYKDHAFIVADAAGRHGVQIFDLTKLRAVGEAPVIFSASAHYDTIHSAHNIVIDEASGFAYVVGASGGGETCGGGLHMIDIREPQAPSFAGCFADTTTGRNKTGYAHDAHCVVYHGPDLEHQGKQLCIGANETAISVADVTDKVHPVGVSAASYPAAAYVHQGWLSEDHRYFYQNDELDELVGSAQRTRTMVWDMSDLDDPVLVNEYFGPTSATDHNLYIKGQLMYQTNNASGLRVLDISDPEAPVEVGFFDTTPYGLDEAGFNGTWSSYPYFDSGIIVLSSRREGLFIVRKRSVDA